MRKKLPQLLVTGGAGFIGSEFVRQAQALGYPVTVVDKLTYAGDLRRLEDVKDRIVFFEEDICNPAGMEKVFSDVRPEIVVHFAAETHVDRSLFDAEVVMKTNVVGTQVLVEVARQTGIERFVHISTDEVYGDIDEGRFREDMPLNPSSPYSAGKAAGDMLIKASIRTYGFPALIVRPSNNYGAWQYPEKFVPVILYKATRDERIPVYGKGLNVREWLFVKDCARGILEAMEKGEIGEVYNLGSGHERTNIQVVEAILKILGKPKSLIEFVEDRPGHDSRYALDSEKAKQAWGWSPRMGFEEGMEETVRSLSENIRWLEGKAEYLQDFWNKVYRRKAPCPK